MAQSENSYSARVPELSRESGFWPPFQSDMPDVIEDARPPAVNAPSPSRGDGGADEHSHSHSPKLRARVRNIQRTKRITSPLRRRRDIVWQVDPPKILKYQAPWLHMYGWIPFLPFRNVRGTVFSSRHLHIQTALLCGWTALVQGVGLGVPDDDLSAFIKFFGTPYLGAVFNAGMLIVFILGLFITLVINRWWSIRTAYAKLSSTTIDLSMIITHMLRAGPRETNAPMADTLAGTSRGPGSPHPPDAKRLVNRARTELIRYLNLGHLLVVTSADAQSKQFGKSGPWKGVWHKLSSWTLYCLDPRLQPMPQQYHPGPLEVTTGNGGINDMETTNTQAPNFHDAADDEADLHKATWSKKVRNIGFEDLHMEGLLNRDEWDIIKAHEKKGMARYLVVYEWTQSLLLRCQQEGWILNFAQTLPMMLNKISTIVESGSTIFTYINSQLPYPYVNLVSMVVHVYLFVLATYVGVLMHIGFPEKRSTHGFSIDAPVSFWVGKDLSNLDDVVALAGSPEADFVSSSVSSSDVDNVNLKWFTLLWLYLIVAVANVTFQGLLDLHGLLDNPFGSHCTQFPLRAQITEVMNATRTLLTSGGGVPAAFCDIFGPDTDAGDGVCSRSVAMSEGGVSIPESGDWMHEGGAPFKRTSTHAAEMFVRGGSIRLWSNSGRGARLTTDETVAIQLQERRERRTRFVRPTLTRRSSPGLYTAGAIGREEDGPEMPGASSDPEADGNGTGLFRFRPRRCDSPAAEAATPKPVNLRRAGHSRNASDPAVGAFSNSFEVPDAHNLPSPFGEATTGPTKATPTATGGPGLAAGLNGSEEISGDMRPYDSSSHHRPRRTATIEGFIDTVPVTRSMSASVSMKDLEWKLDGTCDIGRSATSTSIEERLGSGAEPSALALHMSSGMLNSRSSGGGDSNHVGGGGSGDANGACDCVHGDYDEDGTIYNG